MHDVIDDLKRRAIACKHWRWMPGMLALDSCNEEHPARVIDGCRSVIYEDNDGAVHDGVVSRSDVPDLTDPATLGCILALVRQCFDHAVIWTSRDCTVDALDPDSFCMDETEGWSVCIGSVDDYVGEIGRGATEAEALIVALEAAQCMK